MMKGRFPFLSMSFLPVALPAVSFVDSLALISLALFSVGAITDYRSGKIPNVFVYPAMLSVVVFAFFVEGFYVPLHAVGIAAVLAFGYLFYVRDRWGAGDGKYLILLAFSTLVFSHLKGFDRGLDLFFGTTFLGLSAYIVVSVFFEYRKLGPTAQKWDWNVFRFFRSRMSELRPIAFFVCAAFLLGLTVLPYVSSHRTVIAFLLFFFVAPFLEKIPAKFQYAVMAAALGTLAWKGQWLGFGVTVGVALAVFFVRETALFFLDKADKKEILLWNVRQGDILTEETLDVVERDIGKRYQPYPLQGYEVHEIITAYKESGDPKKKVLVYKDLRMGLGLYAAYAVTVLWMVVTR